MKPKEMLSYNKKKCNVPKYLWFALTYIANIYSADLVEFRQAILECYTNTWHFSFAPQRSNL